MRLNRLIAAIGLLLFGALAARAAPPLSTYGKLPALDIVQISPSGQHIAFVAVDGESRRLFVRDVGGEAIIVTSLGQGKVRELKWVGDDFLLVFASATAKFGNGIQKYWGHETRAELWVALIANIKTHAIRPMFDPKDVGVAFGAIGGDYGSRRLNGRWYEFVSAFDMQLYQDDVYKVDLETGGSSILTKNTGGEYGYVIGDDGAVAAHTRYYEPTRSLLVYAGPIGETADKRVFQRPSPFYSVDIQGLGRTPGTILVGDHDEKTQFWQEYPLAAQASPTPLFDGARVEHTLRDPLTEHLIGAVLDGGQAAVFFDPKLQRRFDAARRAFAAYQISLESYSTDLGKMVIKTDGADDPGTYWLIDMATGKAEDLMSAYPDIAPADVGPTRMFAYKAADGLAMEGVLTLPPGSDGRGLPLVLMPHGGPMDARDRVGFDWWAQAFASRGYAVFQPNYRGSSGYGVPFREAGMGQWGTGMLTDMSDGVAALARAGIVDPSRACIVGASYGGYAALAGVTIQHGIYRCAVSVSGPSDTGADMARKGYDDETPNGRYVQALFGTKDPYGATLRAISPLHHAKQADAPILMIHGKDDTVVPLVNSLAMRDALHAAGKNVELLITDGEDHWLSRSVTRQKTLEASVAFVEAHNPATPPAVASAPPAAK